MLTSFLFSFAFYDLFYDLVVLYVLVCHEACGILAPQPSIEPVPHAMEDVVLTSGLPERSPYRSLLIILSFFFFQVLFSFAPVIDAGSC